MDTPQNPTNIDDYSPAVTLIPFDRPISLLLGPIPADPPDDPFVLVFGDPQSWASAYKACEYRITQQCEAGARIGCSISASNKCALPWWKNLLGVSKEDLVQREKYEEREMASCLEASKSSCREFAKDKCLPAFRGARIAMDGDKNVNWRYTSKLIAWVSMLDKRVGLDLWRMKGSWVEFKSRVGLTICRGSDLLDTDTDTTVNGN